MIELLMALIATIAAALFAVGAFSCNELERDQ